MSSGTMVASAVPVRNGREASATSCVGYVAVRNGRVALIRWPDVPRTAMDAVTAIARLREAAALTDEPELRICFNRAAEHLTRDLAGEVATFERAIEKATADFRD